MQTRGQPGQQQKQKHPEYLWSQTALGSWILGNTEGIGQPVGEFTDSLYLRVGYTVYSQDGTITGTTYSKVAQQLGSYDETVFYGPVTMYAKGLYAGVEEILQGMRKGSRCKVVIPSWLMTYERYDTADEYLENMSDDSTTSIYEIELVDAFDGIMQWGADSIGRYLTKAFPYRYGRDPVKAAADSAGVFGFYYISTKAPADYSELKDTTVYINYIGRLLNGRVFDTTIRDTAIRYGLNRDKTYEPVSITLGDEWSDVTMGSEGNSVIAGFARTLCKMGPYEKGTGVFIPSLGYSYKGSGNSIPAYAPLRFDIELVDEP